MTKMQIIQNVKSLFKHYASASSPANVIPRVYLAVGLRGREGETGYIETKLNSVIYR